MKKTYIFLVLLCLSVVGVHAQTTITSSSSSFPSGYTYGYSTVNQPVAVTFNVINTNAYDIYITKVGYAIYAGYGWAKLYHSSTSITGNGGVSTPTWTQDAEKLGNSSTWSSSIDDNFFTNMCVMIPANTTYRFCMVMEYNITLGIGSPTPTTTNGVTLDCGDVNATRWGHATNLSGTGYGFIGSITFTDCAPPSGLNVTNVKSTSADLAWASSTGTGYEYSLTMSPTPGTPTATTTNSVSVSSLMPATLYYLNVRKTCGTSDKSCWTMTSFTTLPPCTVPANFTINNLTPTSVDFSWDPVVTAINYDYVVDQQSGTPSATGATNTLNNTGAAAPLIEGETYYVHIRTNCSGEQTDWSLDSFTTPIPCRAPVVHNEYIDVDQAVAYWDDVPTATAYEYAITKSATPPSLGTKIEKKSVLMTALLDGVTYYFHVRSQCMSQGIEGLSPWTTSSFKTFPLGVNTINGEGLGMEVYPNPAQNILNLKMLGALQTHATVSLTDISGRVLKQLPLDKNEMTIDISNIAPGIYQLHYKDDVNSKTIKVVKQ